MPFRGRNGNKRDGWRGGFKGGRGRNFDKCNVNMGRIRFDKPEYRHQEQLTEEDVGISEYVSKLDGYPAVIKARFSDFQVNEINIDGKLAKLTETNISNATDFVVKKYSYKDTEQSPSDKIPQVIWEGLKTLVVDVDTVPIELEADNFSKEERTSIHRCVKSYFGQEIVASTIQKNEKTYMQFKKWENKNKKDRIPWPENTPEFVYFIVYKEIMDTMEASFKIAHALKVSPVRITYAGVKDRRAKTTQWFCVKKFQPSKLVSMLKHVRNLKVGNIDFKGECLKIGQLKGNRFRIALRNVIADDELIINSLTHVKEHGFINYYGLQRFGNDKEVPTFLVGIKLLLGQWKQAVDLILKVKAGDDPRICINTAKRVYAETGDASEAVKLCDKRQNNLEQKLLVGLVSHHGNDYVNALESIPRNIRLMYIHAYQSLIWNKMASKRIQEFGFKPVEGDLIFIDDLHEEQPLIEDAADAAEVETESVEQESVQSDDIGKKPLVRPLTADELDKYTIFDIVLPLPGYDVVYPKNLTEFYKEAIEEHGLTLEMPKQRVKTYNLSGTYRKLVQQADDVEWKIMYYNDPTDNLIRSDLEELNGQEEPKSAENGQYKAVVLAFTLNPASYATMVLREVLKCNTSSSAQAVLNNYGEKKPAVTIDDKAEDEIQQRSLLADKVKYEDFKNSLFKDILAETDGESSSVKRELETEENDNSDCKKLKTNADQIN